MAACEAEEHIAALYGDELYGLELDGEVSGEGAMRCACSPVHDEVRGICDMLGLDFTRVDRIATGRAGMLWAGEGMPHRFDACFEIRDIARRLRALRPDGASRSESAGSRKQPRLQKLPIVSAKPPFSVYFFACAGINSPLLVERMTGYGNGRR